MRRSMTAYGRAHKKFSVEISSVNRKGLDINLSLPPTLLFLEPTLRKWVADIATRGQVSIRVAIDLSSPDAIVPLLREEKKKWVKIAKALDFPASVIDFSFLAKQSELKGAPLEEKKVVAELKAVWTLAATAWTKMRAQEGAILVHDIEKRLSILLKEIKQVEKIAPQIKHKYRAKLEERMKELNLRVDEEKIVREAALAAERSDVTEEITRLYSHIEQMKEYLSSKESTVGRTLDFLAQEMGREISTLMAKAGDVSIAKIAVVIKSEIDKIREQVQNIE
jgi:uncharacterized protein (TIGR00255 family)